jgi:muramoyltetrapeptide carboxypeptidase
MEIRSSISLPAAIPDQPTVRIVHPSGRLVGHEDALQSGIEVLEAAGCVVRVDADRCNDSWRGYLAGSDDMRIEEFTSALTEDGVDIIWCARGGSGLNRIAQRVIAEARKSPPRCLVGYSDITALLTPLAQHASWLTFHGPVATSLGMIDPETSICQCLSILRGDIQTIPFNVAPDQTYKHRGRLLGGNLTVLASMLGTPTAPRPEKGAIWLLEDVGEAMYRLDRSFTQLVQAQLFDPSNCIWLGDLGFDSLADHAQIVRQITQDAPCPVMSSAPAGHRGTLAMLPIGASVTIDFRTGLLTGDHDWVCHA